MKSKHLLLLLLIALMAPWAANAQTTMTATCYPPTQTYATGYTSTTEKTSGDMHTVGGSGVQGWMKFDVSSIPDGATINSIKLYFYCTSTSNSYVKLTAAGQLDPVTAEPSALYSAITTTSPNYYTSSYMSGFSSTGWKNFTLSSDAVSNLQNNGLTNDYFTIGFNEYESGNYYLYASGYDATNKPYIEVTYESTEPYVELSPATAKILPGATETLTATPGNVTGTPTYSYSSSNTSVATVSGNGATATVTGVAVGTATITVTMNYEGTDYTATSEITVSNELTVTIGSGSGTNSYLPTHGYYKYSYTQQIYTAAEIGQAGTIKSVSFKGNKAGTRTLVVYMANTTKEIFSAETDYIPISEATQVFSGSVTFTANESKTIELTGDGFDYDGGNLAIIVDDNTGNYDMGTTSWLTFTTTGNQGLYFYQDSGGDINPSNPSATYKGVLTSKNQILLGILPNATPKPAGLTVSNITATGATLTWNAPSSATPTNYSYQYKADGGSWSTLENTTGLSVNLSTLTQATHYTFQVKANYDGDSSDFAEIEFDTPVSANQIVNTVSDPATQMTWDEFADYVSRGLNFPNNTVTLMENITITSQDHQAGTSGHYFSGTFDGNGKTITVNMTATGRKCAPFYGVKDATIKDLAVTGTITSEYSEVGGICGDASGSITFTNCLSNVAITSTCSLSVDDTYGRSTCGGFVGTAGGGVNLNFVGCAFTGSLSANRHGCGGFVGFHYSHNGNWGDNYHGSDSYNNCFFNPSSINIPSTYNSAVLTCGYDGGTSLYSITVTNCYYNEEGADMNTAQGKQAYTITGASPVNVAMYGESTPYSVSGIAAYTAGIIYNSNIYAGSGDNVNLTLTDSPTNDYQANYGTLTNHDTYYTLAMTANNTEISLACSTSVDNLRTGNITAHGATVSWNGVAGAVYEYCLAEGPDYNQTEWKTPSVTSVTFGVGLSNELNDGTDYRFYVLRKCLENVYSDAIYIDFSTPAGNLPPTGLTVASSGITAHTATVSWTRVTTNNYHQSYDLYYSTESTMPETLVPDNLIEDIYNEEHELTGLTGETTYYVWVRDYCGEDDYSTWAGPVDFTTAVSCPAPTNFTADDITNHTAALSWEGTSESYNVNYRTAAYISNPVLTEEFGTSVPTNWERSNTQLTDDVLSGVTTVSTYDGGWNFGTSNGVFDKHARVNIYGTSCKYWLITPSIEIGTNYGLGFDLALTAYSGTLVNPQTTGTDDKFVVLISTDNKATWTILRQWDNSGSAYVYNNITCSATGEYVVFDLSEYAGQSVCIAFYGESLTSNADNNLHIDNVKIGTTVAAGTWQPATPEGTTANLSGLLAERKYEAKVQGNCGAEDGMSRETTIFFTTDKPCPDPTGLQVVENSVKSDRVTLSWESNYANAWVVAYKAESADNFTEEPADENPFILTGLAEETNYTVKVRSNCGTTDGLSVGWSNEVTFTTKAACSAEDVNVSNIMHHSATVNWNGDNKDDDHPGFTVMYRVAEQIDGLSEEFNTTSVPEGWTRYSGLLSDVMNGTALSTISSGWGFSNTYVFGAYHAKVNIYGTSCKYWLVTPQINLANGSALNFDLALTDFNNANGLDVPTGQADDKFVVLISTDNMATWTILGEWNNSGSTYVYNNIATAGENVTIDLSSYSGNVKIAFYGESTVSATNEDNDLHIDNVVIGVPVTAGQWQTKAAANDASSANISGLTAGTRYDVKVVPNCGSEADFESTQFTTISPDIKYFLTEGNWGNANNWEPTGAPTIDQTVTLFANATIESGCVATAKSIAGTGTGENNFTLTIADGGKLKHLNSGVRATVKKTIRPYSTNYDGDTYNNGDYYLIANPITSSYTPKADGTDGFLVGNYDLYSWDYTKADEWINFEASGSTFTTLNYGAYGFLYANENGTDLTYTGTINAYTSYKNRSLSVGSDSNDFPGWYLLGNPYMYDAYLANTSTSGENTNALPYIKMNTAGDGFENVPAGTPIEPMQGFFYQAVTGSTNAYVVTYVPTVSSEGKLNMNLRKGNKQLDNAILVFGGNQQLGKMTFRANSSKVYMPQEGKDYAIVSVESNVGEMPVNFKAESNGTYTLSFTNEEVTFNYLHLIDNMTGNETDLLANPSYTFDARTTDYESRFKLVFATGNNANDDTFAFFSNGSFVINNEGEATLQVIDVNGRILKSESINGCANVNVKAAAGVYVLRLVNGNDVKVQKVVVK